MSSKYMEHYLYIGILCVPTLWMCIIHSPWIWVFRSLKTVRLYQNNELKDVKKFHILELRETAAQKDVHHPNLSRYVLKFC